MSKSSSWRIQSFPDYHDILDRRTDKDGNDKPGHAIELGCFPARHAGCNVYFGLFYTGRRPSIKKIMNSLKRKVDLEESSHYFTGEDTTITLEVLEYEVKESLRQYDA